MSALEILEKLDPENYSIDSILDALLEGSSIKERTREIVSLPEWQHLRISKSFDSWWEQNNAPDPRVNKESWENFTKFALYLYAKKVLKRFRKEEYEENMDNELKQAQKVALVSRQILHAAFAIYGIHKDFDSSFADLVELPDLIVENNEKAFKTGYSHGFDQGYTKGYTKGCNKKEEN